MKWRIRSDSNALLSSSVPSCELRDETNFEEAFSSTDMTGVVGVNVSNVVPRCHQALVDWCQAQFGFEPRFAYVKRQFLGVTNGYDDVSQMGVDRWLALLAAYDQVGSACLVVDAGSAVTIDLLREDGVHQGGYIVPGLRLMKEVLLSKTEGIKLDCVDYDSDPCAGSSTSSAITSGLPLMVVGLICIAERELAALGCKPTILVAGGDGEYLSRLLLARGLLRVEWVPQLVLDGLQLSIEGGK